MSIAYTNGVLSRPHPLHRLPFELILYIIDLLPPESFINLAFAHYPLLESHGLVPSLSHLDLARLVSRTRLPHYLRLIPLPSELLLKTIRYLKPPDVMGFVIANYVDCAQKGIAPNLDERILRRLWAGCWKGGELKMDGKEGTSVANDTNGL